MQNKYTFWQSCTYEKMKNKLKTNSKPLIGTVKLHFIHIELLYENSIHQVSSSFSQIPTTFKMQLYSKWVWLWCGQMYIQCHQASRNHPYNTWTFIFCNHQVKCSHILFECRGIHFKLVSIYKIVKIQQLVCGQGRRHAARLFN